MSIVESSLTIATQLWMSHVVRGFLSERVGNELLRSCLLEMVAAAEMCGVSFELSFGKRGTETEAEGNRETLLPFRTLSTI